jgi:hypothetical protein
MMDGTPTWSRYGSSRRLCARAGCSAPAVATLRFQPTERRAWLAELDDSAARSQGDLCARHAAALVLPRGWELYDERPLVAAGGAAPPREPTPIEAVEVVDETADDTAAIDIANGNGAAGPVLGADDDAVDEALDSILDARTPLLRRAFRNSRPAS